MSAVALALSPSMTRGQRRFGWLMTTPGLLLLVLVIAFPVGWALLTSLYDYTLIAPGFDRFVGVDNYAAALGDAGFLHALWVTARFVAAVVLLEFALGLSVALALHATERGKSLYYAILLIPLLMNPVVVGLIWRMFLHPSLGIVNYLIGITGLPPVNWLGDADVAFWTVVLVDGWHQVSFMIVLLLAGLSALPTEPQEAARIDGASALQTFWYVILPMLRPVIVVTLLLRMVFAVKTYDLVYIMTRGGPGSATDLVSYFVYRSAFTGLDLGRACAMSAMLLAAMVLVAAFLYPKLREADRDDA